MNLNHLTAFQAVAAEGSVSRGAERLHVSQPAVSKQLQELERSLGMPLFERLPRGVRLTEAGELLACYAGRLFALEAEAEQALRELQGLERGRLVVGASLTIGTYLLPEVFGAFHRRYPQIELHLEIANTEVVQHQLAAGALDLGLTEGFLETEALTADVIGEDEIVAVVAPGHPLASGPPVPLNRLAREPFVLREAGSGTRAVVERALAARGITLVPVMSLGSIEAIKRAVAAGIGAAFISRLAITLEVEAGRLVVLPVEDFLLRRPLHRLRRRGAHESRAARAFLAELRHALFTGGLTRSEGATVL